MGNVPLMVEEEERRERRFRQIIDRRLIRQYVDAFRMSEARFIATFRLSKEAVHYIILGIGPALQPRGGPLNFIPVPNRILCALYFLANGSYQGPVGNSLFACMSQPSVSRFIESVSKALAQWGMRFVQFPASEVDKFYVKNMFLENIGLPDIIGCVDGTHVAIFTPTEREDAYVNRKGYHSINTQIVCDYDLRILNVVAKFPGSTHDSYVWRNSRVSRIMGGNYENGDNSKLLGDSGYPLQPWLLTPFPNPRPNSHEARYNVLHSRGRNCVERCIGLLKGRWRCLLRDRTLHYRPQAACRVIMACAALHNIAVLFRMEEIPPELDEIDREAPPPLERQDARHEYMTGQRVRDAYAMTLN